MALLHDRESVATQLREVFIERDDQDGISQKVMMRDIPKRDGIQETDFDEYFQKSYGSIDYNGDADEPAVPQYHQVDSEVSDGAAVMDGGVAPIETQTKNDQLEEEGHVSFAIKRAPTIGFAPTIQTLHRDTEPTSPSLPSSGTTGASGLRELLTKSQSIETPFDSFWQLSGEGYQEKDRLSLQVFFPFAEDETNRHDPVRVQVLRKATVEELIGLVMCMYIRDARQPKLKYNAAAYELRMIEDDHEPDLDLPALDRNQPISKFEFGQYCLCKGPRYASLDATPDKPSPWNVVVYLVQTQDMQPLKSTFLREPKMTIADVMEKVDRKRRMSHTRPGLQFDITLKDSVQHLDVSTRLTDLDRAGVDPALFPLELSLVQKNSRRYGQEENVEDDGWALVEKSLTVHQAKTYLLSKHNKYSAKRMVEMFVDTEKISFNPHGKALWSAKQHKPIQLDFDCLESVEVKNSLIRFIHTDAESSVTQKLEFSASSPVEAGEIKDKINSIIQSKASDRVDRRSSAFPERTLSTPHRGERRKSMDRENLGR
eukprot:m.40732 g.40732  ORF g.40732 m.40732 type:complete len:542 (-) comp18596_c0_seq1:203-1828(-)